MAVILIVEDNDDVTPLEIALASLQGLDTLVARNGHEALEVFERGTPEIVAIITDINLPIFDGLEIISCIRSGSRNTHIPIIVISGENDISTQTRARELGANAFFVKPYSPVTVRNTLEGLLHAT